jgi:hypothetical protein
MSHHDKHGKCGQNTDNGLQVFRDTAGRPTTNYLVCAPDQTNLVVSTAVCENGEVAGRSGARQGGLLRHTQETSYIPASECPIPSRAILAHTRRPYPSHSLPTRKTLLHRRQHDTSKTACKPGGPAFDICVRSEASTTYSLLGGHS